MTPDRILVNDPALAKGLDHSRIYSAEGVAPIIVLNANKEGFGSILASSSVWDFTTDFPKEITKPLMIPGELDTLVKFVQDHNLQVGSDLSVNFKPMRLVVVEKESDFFVTPRAFSSKPKINPSTGKVLVTEAGKVIFRKIKAVDAASEIVDVTVEHSGEGMSLAEYLVGLAKGQATQNTQSQETSEAAPDELEKQSVEEPAEA